MGQVEERLVRMGDHWVMIKTFFGAVAPEELKGGCPVGANEWSFLIDETDARDFLLRNRMFDEVERYFMVQTEAFVVIPIPLTRDELHRLRSDRDHYRAFYQRLCSDRDYEQDWNIDKKEAAVLLQRERERYLDAVRELRICQNQSRLKDVQRSRLYEENERLRAELKELEDYKE